MLGISGRFYSAVVLRNFSQYSALLTREIKSSSVQMRMEMGLGLGSGIRIKVRVRVSLRIWVTVSFCEVLSRFQ